MKKLLLLYLIVSTISHPAAHTARDNEIASILTQLQSVLRKHKNRAQSASITDTRDRSSIASEQEKARKLDDKFGIFVQILVHDEARLTPAQRDAFLKTIIKPASELFSSIQLKPAQLFAL